MTYSLAIHGGAGTIDPGLMTPALEQDYLNGLRLALQAGQDILSQGGTACDAVTAAVKELEDCPLFNAGRGSVFNSEGRHEMDASLMLGADLRAGAVCGVTGIRNPILLAKAVMERSAHVMMAGTGAEAFARSAGVETASDDYFYTEHRFRQWQELRDSERFELDHGSKPGNKMGTVGAVARDVHGDLAAATSTGGMTNKKFGRIGDSPVIGAGTYANNRTCAISCTGHGELFLRAVVAYDISCLMEYRGLSLKEACEKVVMDKLVKLGGEGGLVAVDAAGHIEMPFNSGGMYRASVTQHGEAYLGIYR